MSTEKQMIAEAGKIRELRSRIVQTAYLTATQVCEHLHISRPTLDGIPMEVLPWVPGPGSARVHRRYHPADVAAYPARARRWKVAQETGREAEVLEKMRADLEQRDRQAIADALGGHAA